MQTKELGLATSKVADIRVISGRGTAEESTRDLQTEKTEKESQRPRIVSLSVSWCFMAAGLFVALAPMPARAADPIKVLEAQVAALQSQVNTQQGQITTLQSQVGTLQTSNTTLQSQVTTLQNQLTVAQPVLALGPLLSASIPTPSLA
jgi:septal ring factor EnvC (AmiA/AmiB activator)